MLNLIKSQDMIELEKQLKERGLPPATHAAQTLIFKQGARFEGLYCICHGRVKIEARAADKDVFLWLASRGDLIGLNSYFSNSDTYTHSAYVGEADSRLIFISKEAFSQVLQDTPGLSKMLMQILINRAHFAELRTGSMLNKSIRKRLARIMLFLRARRLEVDPVSDNDTDELSYSPYELADLAGTTSSYAKRILREFRERKLIYYQQNRLRIRDADRLRRM